MLRLLATALIAGALLAPTALAQKDVALDEPAQPRLPDLAPVGRAIASGASAAADATGDAASALASGLASLAKATAGALSAAAAALGAALAAAFAALGAGLLALGHALGAALAALGALLADLAAALGKLLGRAARAVAAHPKESAIVAGSASGLAGLAYAAKKLWPGVLLPLYSRLAKSEMLDNKVRASVYEHVKAHPGAHPSGIADALGLGWGTVVYHLARLEEASLVTPREAHHRKCYFAVGGELDAAGRSAVAAMSTDKARAIVDAVRASPGLSQKELAETLGMSQALASWHVKRLVASGVLVPTRAGRSNLLHVAEHVPVVTAPLGAVTG